MGRSPRSTWRARAAAPGPGSPATHASRELPKTIVEHERLAAQFLGDLDALDRLDGLASQFAEVDHSYRAALVQAEVASSGTSLRRGPGPPRAGRAAGWPRRGHRAPTPGDRSGMWRRARSGARRPPPHRRSRAAGSKIWCRSAPCSPISSASPKRRRSIGRRLTRTTTCRPSRWRGSAFSSACCGESSRPYRSRIVPRSGITARSPTCRDM